MLSKAYLFTAVAALLTLAEAHPLDQGPQTFDNQLQQPIQQYKEVIMYLTPTQIRAYEESQKKQAVTNEKPVFEQDISLNNDSSWHQLYQREEKTPDLFTQHTPYSPYQQFKQQQSPLISEQNIQQIYVSPNLEKNGFRQLAPQIQITAGQRLGDPQTRAQELSRNYVYFNFKPDAPHKLQDAHPQLFYPDPEYQKSQQDNIQYLNTVKSPATQQKFQLIPYEYIPDSRQLHENLGKQLLEHPILNDINIKGNMHPSSTSTEHQYAPQYSHQYEQIKDIINAIELEKTQARAKVEAIARSPPLVVHKDISITRRRPVHIIKAIKVPVPAPFLLPVPQPYEVKVPQPYPVPVEIIRPFAIPVVKTEKVEVEKPVPYEVEKRVPVEVEKKVYVKVEKPYPVERVVPVEIRREVPVEVPLYDPEKLTIVRHVWDH